MQLNGSQIFVEVLCEQGVDTLFGYPGGAVLNLYDELYKNSGRWWPAPHRCGRWHGHNRLPRGPRPVHVPSAHG